MNGPGTLAGRSVLVTGAAGFVGSHLVEALAGQGAQVRAFVRYGSSGGTGWLAQLPPELAPRVEVIAGDIRDLRRVREAVQGCDVVFHLAALISIPYSYVAPASYVDVNVLGTLNVLEAARHAGGVTVVQTSTSEVYGTPESVPITEAHPLRAQSPYAATKIAADKLCESYQLSFAQPVVILRPFNTYGPRQSARAVLPTILGQLLAGREAVELGSTWPRRDLTFVSDVVQGFLRAAVSPRALGRTVQLGSGRDVSIAELAQLAMDVVGRRVPIVERGERTRPEASEVKVLRSAPDLARELLGWHAEVPLEEGVRRTAEWLRAHPEALVAEGYRV